MADDEDNTVETNGHENDVYIDVAADGYDVADEDRLEIEEGSKPKSKNVRRRAADTDFSYTCEWNGCDHVTGSMNEFNHHVSRHIRGYTKDMDSGKYIMFCQWAECNASMEGELDDFSRHVYYHTFHQYLKYVGQHIQHVESISPCLLDTSSRNVIPELPEKLVCRWMDCGMVYDNPYIFYSHVTHHCEDFPKGTDPRVKVKCKWEGCTVTTKSWFKMKDHVRSHTQAKVVACPVCGSLFASNTRYIDHLKRQSQVADELKFECSHCNNRFGSERILRDHMRHHVNHYKCPLCDMTCHSPSAVRDHVRYRHSEERSHTCEYCQYKGKTLADLRRHVVTHGVKAQYSCKRPDCHHVFSGKKQLINHYYKEHENPNYQYQCHVCNKKFVRGTYLTVHLREVHRYRWPSGHKRFRYKLHEDGMRRLQTIRYESIEVSQQVLGQNLSPHPENHPDAAGSGSDDGDIGDSGSDSDIDDLGSFGAIDNDGQSHRVEIQNGNDVVEKAEDVWREEKNVAVYVEGGNEGGMLPTCSVTLERLPEQQSDYKVVVSDHANLFDLGGDNQTDQKPEYKVVVGDQTNLVGSGVDDQTDQQPEYKVVVSGQTNLVGSGVDDQTDQQPEYKVVVRDQTNLVGSGVDDQTDQQAEYKVVVSDQTNLVGSEQGEDNPVDQLSGTNTRKRKRNSKKQEAIQEGTRSGGRKKRGKKTNDLYNLQMLGEVALNLQGTQHNNQEN